VHYREVLVKEKIKAFRINESVLEAFRIILVLLVLLDRVEVETQGKGNIGNKPGFSRVSFPRNNKSAALGVSGF